MEAGFRTEWLETAGKRLVSFPDKNPESVLQQSLPVIKNPACARTGIHTHTLIQFAYGCMPCRQL